MAPQEFIAKKAPDKNLDQALKQLQTYSLALSNPPPEKT